MSAPIEVRVRCVSVPESLRRTGIHCFAQIVIEETLYVDGLAVRKTERGDYVVTWPERRDGLGRPHAVVRLLDPETRTNVEHAVLVEAARGGWIEARAERQAGAP